MQESQQQLKRKFLGYVFVAKGLKTQGALYPKAPKKAKQKDPTLFSHFFMT